MSDLWEKEIRSSFEETRDEGHTDGRAAMDAHALKISKNWAEQRTARIAALRRPFGESGWTGLGVCASSSGALSLDVSAFSIGMSSEDARVEDAVEDIT